MESPDTAQISPADIDLVVFDFDGVLTDNRVLVFDDGHEAVFCNRSDGIAFELFRAYQVPVLILSKEKNPVVAARAAKLRVPAIQGIDDKKTALREYCAAQQITPERVLYVGNDLNDLSVMRIVGHPFCPADSHPAILSFSRRLQSRGGEGVAREIAETVLGLAYPEKPD